jgi:hypothetical protein
MDAEQKMRAGFDVTILEIIETFCRLEETPTGRVPTDGTVELIRRKVAEAEMRGLLTSPASSRT